MMRHLDLHISTLTSPSIWYYGETTKQTTTHIVYTGLESVVLQHQTPSFPQNTYSAARNLDYLEDAITKSKEVGLYDRLESFLHDTYGKAPRERYRVEHDSIDDAVLAYTDTISTIGVGPKFTQGANDIAADYGITPTLAAFLTYAHERAHMAQAKHYTTKEAEMDADTTIATFLEQEAAQARAKGDLFAARQYANAALYQHHRVTQVHNDRIDAYKDAA